MGLTTIMVTHDQEEALTMADRIVVMNKAEVMQCGTPEEVYQTPENPFVADFIGSINFISKRKDHIYQADDDSGVFAIRPEKIHLRKQAGGKFGERRDRGYRIQRILLPGQCSHQTCCQERYQYLCGRSFYAGEENEADRRRDRISAVA